MATLVDPWLDELGNLDEEEALLVLDLLEEEAQDSTNGALLLLLAAALLAATRGWAPAALAGTLRSTWEENVRLGVGNLGAGRPWAEQVPPRSLDELRERVTEVLVDAPVPEAVQETLDAVLARADQEGWSSERTMDVLDVVLDSPSKVPEELAEPSASEPAAPEGAAPPPVIAPGRWDAIVHRTLRTVSTAILAQQTLEALREAGHTSKRWVTRQDARVRESHVAANGQVVLLGEPFQVGQEQLMYPGDPAGSPEEIENCRCVIVSGDVTRSEEYVL